MWYKPEKKIYIYIKQQNELFYTAKITGMTQEARLYLQMAAAVLM